MSAGAAALGVGLPLVLTAVFGGGFVLNEWTHGGLSEAMGIGHRHMLDAGGYHCVGHEDSEMAERHHSHMHGASNASEPEGMRGHHSGSNATVPHDRCPGHAGAGDGGAAG